MKAGYSLLELMIGMLLASMLAITLFQSVTNTTQTVQVADDIMDFDVRVATFHHQFQKDTAGIFVPEKPQAEQKPSPEAKQNQVSKPQEQKPIQFPDKLFYAVNKDDQLELFTGITTNPVRVYQRAHNSNIPPRMVRIVYRLEQDKKRKDSYTLYRQESEDLTMKAFEPKAEKPIRKFALLSDIKKISLDFSYPVKKEDKKAEKVEASAPQAPPKQPAQPQIEKIVIRADWPFKTGQEAKEKKVPLYPESIVVKLSLWDNTHTGERSFELAYPIASFTLFDKKKKKAPPPQKNITVTRQSSLKQETEQKLAKLGEQIMAVFTKQTKVKA